MPTTDGAWEMIKAHLKAEVGCRNKCDNHWDSLECENKVKEVRQRRCRI